MSGRWFRFYAGAMRNPKVLRLSDKDFRLWVGLMAIASENDGAIPNVNDLKLMLGMRLDHVKEGLNRLISGGLVDVLEVGYEPHNWSKFQYKSDTSNERVAKHRAKCNVTVTPPDTDTDTDSNDAKASYVVSVETPPTPANDFEAEESLKPAEVVEAWNIVAAKHGLPMVKKLTPARKRALNARLRQHTIQDFSEAIAAIGRSPFLHGENNRGWRADFDFLLQPTSFTRLIEGTYDSADAKPPRFQQRH